MNNFKNQKILLTGGYGFLGRHVYAELLKKGAEKKQIFLAGRKDFDLRNFAECSRAVKGKDLVIHLAANFDGLKYNTEHAAEVFYDNSVMGVNLVKASREAGVKKFVLVGTVGSYPKDAEVPYREEDFWNGLPEQGNDSYGLSKKMVAAAMSAFRQQYGFVGINLVLANMYGPGDHFDLNRANVIPALIHKFIKAKNSSENIIMWGSGKATREFLYVEDAAKAIVLAARKYQGAEPVNIGSGKETRIKDLAESLSKLLGFKGKIIWDKTKPEGQRRRVMSVEKAKKYFGFKAKTGLFAGLELTVDWYNKNI